MPGLKLVAELGGDGSGFNAMMNRADARVRQFATSSIAPLKNIIAGAFTVGAISSLTRKTIEFASHIRDVSDALRVNVEWFQKRANAAALAGASEDDLAKFIDNLNKARAAAVQQPGGTEAKRFERLGFSGQEVQGMNTAAFFDKLVAAFGQGATAQTAVDVEAVGGRTARNLLAAFHNQFQSDAPIFSEDLINQLDDIGDEFTILGRILMIEVAPAILAVANAARKLIGNIGQTGAGLGAGHEAAKAGAAEDIAAGVPLPQRMFNVFKNFAKGFQKQVVSMDADSQATDEQMQSARAQARQARRRREQAPPGFERLDLDRRQPRVRLPTDALVGVGNFLGRNQALVNNIAGQQLQVARQHLDIATKTMDLIKKIGVIRPGSSENVPPLS